VTNWLADPVACIARLRKEEGGCIVLAGRNEVLSRSTRVYRAVEDEGTKNEATIWSAGHVQVVREGQDQRRDHGKANLNLVYWTTPSDGVEVGPLLASEAILMSDVLRAAAVSAGGSACGGQTLLELMWDELMTIIERLMTGQDAEDDRGMAQGMAYAIAIMQNPYRPNVDAIRVQAMDKWNEENPDG
jgi:hypothetical protein